ncbi:hypothetical protein FHEFKHOI_00586 [Candidatus Methanoperedenaceae archaeon GB50]|nr:hypothetical protein AIOGIFDO_00584 [Candidatus Methanoperedenaceae archaeon GB37]CAD7769368.1 hypothetical protein FHEFKHOI_00586 [Candidatus Methanoperedenaceae archaeon GB50]
MSVAAFRNKKCQKVRVVDLQVLLMRKVYPVSLK